MDQVKSGVVDAIGFTLIDTIGIDERNEELRKEAGRALSAELRQRGAYKFVFVFNDNWGGIEESDRQCSKVVLGAVPALAQDGYGIVVNNCSSETAQNAKDNLEWRKYVLGYIFGGIEPTTKHIPFFKTARVSSW